MTRLLLTHIDILATMNDRPAGAHSCGEELSDAALLIENGVISEVGSSAALSQHISRVDEVIDLSGHIVIPGLIRIIICFRI